MLDYHTLVSFLETNYGEFVDHCGSEEAADEIINALRREGGMDTDG